VPARLILSDALSVNDLLTFAGRAERFGGDGVRLVARGGVLTAQTAMLAPQGLLDQTPTIIGMRVYGADPELECDLVVAAGTLSAVPGEPTSVGLPETAMAPAWAGIAPPRGGWEPAGQLAASTIAERAQWGMSAVAHDVPSSAGEDVVRMVRASVWGPADEHLGNLPRGVAFAAFALGFIRGDETVRVLRSERWTRMTFDRGHVLVRGPVKSGLTPVLRAGA